MTTVRPFVRPFRPIFRSAVAAALACAGFAAGASPSDDLWRAIGIDNARGVESLLASGAVEPNLRDEKGQVALYVALRDGSERVAKVLIAQPRLDLEARNAAGETPLMMAALHGEVDSMRALIERGAKVHQDGWAPIHYAACAPDQKAVALLLERGAPVDPRAPEGSTPLMMAALYGAGDTVDLLLARGADRHLSNAKNQTAADRAGFSGRDWLVKRLAANDR